LALQRTAIADALSLAERAWSTEPASTPVLLNLVTARSVAGDVAGALEAGRLLEQASHPQFALLGRVYRRTFETSLHGSLDVAARELKELGASLRLRGERHFLGVSLANAAYINTAMGKAEEGLSAADDAIANLAATSGGIELVSARLARASALAFLGDMAVAREEMRTAVESAPPGQATEVALEVAMLEALLGESFRAWPLVDRVVGALSLASDQGEQLLVARVLLNTRDHNLDLARRDVGLLRYGEPRSAEAFEARRYLAKGLVLALDGSSEALTAIHTGTQIAQGQQAHLWSRYGELLGVLADLASDPSAVVSQMGHEMPVVLSMAAELVLKRMKDLDSQALAQATTEAERRPWRWRGSTRRQTESALVPDRHLAALLLESIGEPEDVPRLREVGRALRLRQPARLGTRLARRLARRVLVEDLGRVRISTGDRVVEAGEVRRKVLALLCLLVSKARFASTREEVVDNLWPDNDPASAQNSLNQTVYFLRRVFEPDYLEDTSPGYVGQDGETIWLDPELVDARSRRCLELIRSIAGPPSPEAAIALAHEYRGKFALDFAYEEWSTPYRDSLHASYLRVMEHAIRIDLDSGHFDRGIFLAERAAEVDPDAEEIQVALVRLYRHSGAHAAAAQQYGHYALTLKDLGVDPVPFNEV
jgi:DNA-binding SARP family transcriptional activator